MPIIAVCAPPFSGGEQLARRVAKLLALPLIQDSIILERASAWGGKRDELEDVLRRPASPWQGIRRRRASLLLLRAAVAVEVQPAGAVLDPSVAALVPPGTPGLLRVRVIAPFEERTTAAQVRLHVSRDQAVALLKKTDARREESRDDLVLNLGYLDLSGASRIVAHVAQQAVVPDVQDYVLSSQVQTQLARSRSLAPVALHRTGHIMPAKLRFRPAWGLIGGVLVLVIAYSVLVNTVADQVVEFALSHVPRTFAGVITDTNCQGEHEPDVGAECVRRCVRIGNNVKYAIFVDGEEFVLSDQQAGERYAARNVSVRGVVDRESKILKVRSIEPL